MIRVIVLSVAVLGLAACESGLGENLLDRNNRNFMDVTATQ